MPKPKADTEARTSHAKKCLAHREGNGTTVRLKYHQPFDWQAIVSFLAARAIDGVEKLQDGRYIRSISIKQTPALVEITNMAKASCLEARIFIDDEANLAAITSRLAQMFDLDADVTAIGAVLKRDPLLEPLVARRPGLRVVRNWDSFELAIRAVLGQQVTLEAGRKLTQTLVQRCASNFTLRQGFDSDINALFPSAEQVAQADLTPLPMPTARKRTLVALANAALDDANLFQRLASIEETTARLQLIKGVGEWTAHYIAMRGCNEPDAFPASDAALLRNMGLITGEKPHKHDFIEYAQRWRPWRSYAAQHLWLSQR